MPDNVSYLPTLWLRAKYFLLSYPKWEGERQRYFDEFIDITDVFQVEMLNDYFLIALVMRLIILIVC